MNIIAAVDKNWAIGFQGNLLVSIPSDQKMFREETIGKVVVMGRKTLESLPGGQPLANRVNIVLSRNPDFSVKGAAVCRSIEEALEECKKYADEDIFIAGGHEIYQQFLPFCQFAHLTCIDYAYQADAYMPNLEKDPDWEMVMESEEQTYFDLCYTFRMYCRKSKLTQIVQTLKKESNSKKFLDF